MGHYGVGRDRRCPLASLVGARIVLVTATMLTAAEMWNFILLPYNLSILTFLAFFCLFSFFRSLYLYLSLCVSGRISNNHVPRLQSEPIAGILPLLFELKCVMEITAHCRVYRNLYVINYFLLTTLTVWLLV